MKKICKICSGNFETKTHRLYCSSKCQNEARVGILLPDTNKKYRHQLNIVQCQKWSSKCYN